MCLRWSHPGQRGSHCPQCLGPWPKTCPWDANDHFPVVEHECWADCRCPTPRCHGSPGPQRGHVQQATARWPQHQLGSKLGWGEKGERRWCLIPSKDPSFSSLNTLLLHFLMENFRLSVFSTHGRKNNLLFCYSARVIRPLQPHMLQFCPPWQSWSLCGLGPAPSFLFFQFLSPY